jgi:hypothetical protein
VDSVEKESTENTDEGTDKHRCYIYPCTSVEKESTKTTDEVTDEHRCYIYPCISVENISGVSGKEISGGQWRKPVILIFLYF